MRCAEVKNRLVADRASAEVAAHLEGCGSCREFSARLEATRRSLAGRLTEVEPGPGFAARVIAELAPAPDPLGWAALRVLPATLALALVLCGWALLSPSPTELLAESPTDDLISWVLEDGTASAGAVREGD